MAVIAYQLYAVLYPFLTPIAWAILLAFLFHPALLALNRIIPRRTTCAVIITVAVALGVILPAIWISAKLLHEAHVVTVPGEAFGTSQHVRISYPVTKQNIDEGTRRMKEFLTKLA